MSYEWPLDPQDLFTERYAQMTRGSLTAEDVDPVRARVTDMWVDGPGGWVYEWSQLASRYVSEGRNDLACLAYGWAKFPTLANPRMREALERQIDQYQQWASSFPVDFERRVITVPFDGAATTVPVHILSPKRVAPDAPILLASGGVDTWKMDLHPMFQVFAQHAGLRVMTFDIPGTGESKIALSPHGAQVIAGLAAEARRLGARKVGHLGISMGGYFSARSGLENVVDAAIVLGGPVGSVPPAPDRKWHFGMADILGNALGLDHPKPEEVAMRMSAFTLRAQLEQDANAPMLVINGADDIHVPIQDTLVFKGRRDTEVEVIEGAGHCAVTRFDYVIPKMVGWIAQALR